MILVVSPYRLVFEKACHIPVELEHRVLWAIKQLNSNLDNISGTSKTVNF